MNHKKWNKSQASAAFLSHVMPLVAKMRESNDAVLRAHADQFDAVMMKKNTTCGDVMVVINGAMEYINTEAAAGRRIEK